MSDVRIRFCGAAQEVTGSMHLVEANGHKIVLDCGLFQGKRKESNEKNRQLCENADRIDAVILSHAHVDHCGRLPMLVKQGFRGNVFATPATCDLARILLADSAHIQEEDAEYWNKKRVKRGDEPIEPLYTADDVEDTIKLFQPRRLNNPFEVVPGVTGLLVEAGHMLGSSMVNLQIANGDEPISLTYTGDLGREGMQILRDPSAIPASDFLISESTYGGRDTSSPEPMREEFAEIINEIIDQRGKLVIPSFAVGRAQVLVYEYHVGILEGLIKKQIPLIVDSPLAVRATEVFRQHPEVFDSEAYAFNALTGGMLDSDSVEYTQSVADSKALNDRPGPMIIISASGMCEVGRILHHLKNNIEDPNNTVLIVGYQAANTLGRRIADGAKQIKVFGETYEVKAKVKVLTGFSAHANASELLERISPLREHLKGVFLVHGELGQAQALAGTLRNGGFKNVQIPEPHQTISLNGEMI